MIHVVDWIPTLISAVKDNLGQNEKDIAEAFATNGMDGVDQWNTLAKSQPSKRNEFLYNIDPLFDNNGREIGQSGLR